MGHIVIRIETDNAAFENNRGPEVRRILKEAGARLVDGSRKLRDLNGNTVGSIAIDEEDGRASAADERAAHRQLTERTCLLAGVVEKYRAEVEGESGLDADFISDMVAWLREAATLIGRPYKRA